MKTLIFLLIFIFSLSSSEVEDDFMATLVRAKRAKVHKVTADVTSSYHDAIKTKLLAKLGRKPYVVPRMNQRDFIDKEVSVIVDTIKRQGKKEELNSVQLEQIKSDTTRLYNILSEQANTILFDSINKAGSDADVDQCRKDIIATDLITELTRLTLLGRLNAKIMLLKSNKSDRDSYDKLQAYWKSILANTVIKTFQKEHIMVLLQFEMKSFIMDKVRSEKVRRNSIREIVTYFNSLETNDLIHPDSMNDVCTVLASEISSIISNDSKSRNSLEKVDEIWEILHRSPILSSSEKENHWTSLRSELSTLLRSLMDDSKQMDSIKKIDVAAKRIARLNLLTSSEKTSRKSRLEGVMHKIAKKDAHECTTAECMDNLWREVHSCSLLTPEEKKNLKSELVSEAFNHSAKHQKNPEAFDLLWKGIEASSIITFSEKTSLKSRLDGVMHKVAKESAHKCTTDECTNNLWRVVHSSCLLTPEHKESVRVLLHNTISVVFNKIVKEQKTPETLFLLWKGIESYSFLTVSEKTPLRSQLQDEMNNYIKNKLHEDFVIHASPNKNRGFWTNIESSSLFTITKKEKLRISVAEEASLLIEDQLSKKKTLLALGENIHTLRKVIYSNDFLSYTNQELLVSFANEYLLELAREGRKFRTSTSIMQRQIQELVNSSMDRESKGLLIRELNNEIKEVENGNLDGNGDHVENFNGINTKLKNIFFDEKFDSGYIYIYINSHCLPFIDQSKPLMREQFLRSISYIGMGHGKRMLGHIAEIRSIMANIEKLDGKPIRKVDDFASTLETNGKLIVMKTTIPMSDKEVATREAILIEYMLDNSYSISNSKREFIPKKARILSDAEKELVVYHTIKNLMEQFEQQQYFEFGKDTSEDKVPPTAPSKEMRYRPSSAVSSIHCIHDPRRVIVWKYNDEHQCWVMERPKFSELKSSYIKTNLPAHIRAQLPME